MLNYDFPQLAEVVEICLPLLLADFYIENAVRSPQHSVVSLDEFIPGLHEESRPQAHFQRLEPLRNVFARQPDTVFPRGPNFVSDLSVHVCHEMAPRVD